MGTHRGLFDWGREGCPQFGLEHWVRSDSRPPGAFLSRQSPRLQKVMQNSTQRDLLVLNSGSRSEVGVQPGQIGFCEAPKRSGAAEKNVPIPRDGTMGFMSVCALLGDIGPEKRLI